MSIYPADGKVEPLLLIQLKADINHILNVSVPSIESNGWRTQFIVLKFDSPFPSKLPASTTGTIHRAQAESAKKFSHFAVDQQTRVKISSVKNNSEYF